MKKSYELNSADDLESENLRLTRQARILYDWEKDVLSEALRGCNERVVDFGCGNGAFTTLMADACQQVSGCDVNESLLSLARSLECEIDFFSVRGLCPDNIVRQLSLRQPSAIVMRFVVQHLNREEWGILRRICEYCITHTCRLVIIDIDDSEMETSPHCRKVHDVFAGLSQYTRTKGGDRLLNRRLKDAFSDWRVRPATVTRVNIQWDEDTAEEFHAVMAPGLSRAIGDDTGASVTKIFRDFFVIREGTLIMPLFYHIL